MLETHKEKPFGKLRSLLWPIYRHELKKFVPMFLFFFFISINYHLLRITKDAVIVTAPGSGAEVLPFLKPFAVLPMAIIMVFIFTRFSNRFNKENIFYAIVGIFLLFFLTFALYLYPNRDLLTPDRFADFLRSHLPIGFKGLIAMMRYWIFTLYYVMAESWSVVVFSILMWGFANDVTKIEESKRFYALFGIAINSSGILAGSVGERMFSNCAAYVNPISAYFGCVNGWDQNFLIMIGIVIVLALLSMLIYRFLHIYIFSFHTLQSTIVKEKPKVSLRSNLKYIFKSKYLLMISVIVFAYYLTDNMTEILWKSQMKELFPKADGYAAYNSKITFYIGLIATLSSFCISGNIIRRLGWKFAAYITPFVIIITGIGFFYFLILKETSPNLSFTILGMTPLALTVFFGSLQNCLIRSSKYTLFDDTKEMAFIPLDANMRIQGKSAIDGIGSRLGKTGSSLIMQFFIFMFTSAAASAPYVMGVLFIVVFIWLLAIKFLGREFEAYAKKEKEPSVVEIS